MHAQSHVSSSTTISWGPGRRRDEHVPAADRDRAWRLIADLGPVFGAGVVRLLTADDLIAVHGLHGEGADAQVGFDVFRVEQGHLADRWIAHRPIAATARRHAETDGPTEITRPGQTPTTRRLTDYLIDTILVGRKYHRLRHFISADLVEHGSRAGSGAAALLAAWQEPGTVYLRRYATIAEGEFALSIANGTLRHRPVVFYDLFRVDRGMIAEHWQTAAVGPAPNVHPGARCDVHRLT